MSIQWFLDVDGVLNANNPGWSELPRSGTASVPWSSFRIRWAPSLVDRIIKIHDGGKAQIFWATTWCAYAERIEGLLGLPEFRRAFTEDVGGWAARQAKFAAVKAAVLAGQDVVWTDDEAISRDMERELRAIATGRLLIIRPDSNRGLQPEHIDLIEYFLENDERAT